MEKTPTPVTTNDVSFLNRWLIGVLLTTSFPVHAWSLFGSYDDCVLDNIKNATTPQALSVVRKSCRSKYPPEGVTENNIKDVWKTGQ